MVIGGTQGGRRRIPIVTIASCAHGKAGVRGNRGLPIMMVVQWNKGGLTGQLAQTGKESRLVTLGKTWIALSGVVVKIIPESMA